MSQLTSENIAAALGRGTPSSSSLAALYAVLTSQDTDSEVDEIALLRSLSVSELESFVQHCCVAFLSGSLATRAVLSPWLFSALVVRVPDEKTSRDLLSLVAALCANPTVGSAAGILAGKLRVLLPTVEQ